MLILVTLFILNVSRAQTYDSLQSIELSNLHIFYSNSAKKSAEENTRLIQNALIYFQKLLSYTPDVTLLILDPVDWKKYSTLGAVYGMPHYNNENKTLYVASEDNAFWSSFVPPLEQLPPDLSDQIRKVYTTSEGKVSMKAFFDLLAIHELGHAFHNQAKIKMQRSWFCEMYVNILLHTYIAENEPGFLPALEVFPKMVINGGSKDFKYKTLADLENYYNDIARDSPRNYGWYQCRWHAAAAVIYNKSGKKAALKLWNGLRGFDEKLSEEDFIKFLKKTEPATAAILANWDLDTI